MNNLHTFVICAYKESAFLEDCIKSLLAQTVPSTLLLATSTPNEYISALAEKYDIPLYINEGESGITGDWNFALSKAETPFATIAHQDDVYEPTYTEEVLKKAQKYKKPLIVFTDYFEIRNGERVVKSGLLRIKRLMNVGFRVFKRNRFMRRRVLSLGCSICCPSVTFCAAARADFKFDKNFKCACDWDAWDRIAKKKGAFLYIAKPLTGHRIHEGSETTKLIANNVRAQEEYTMFRRYWPAFIARKLSGAYAKGADSNNLTKD